MFLIFLSQFCFIIPDLCLYGKSSNENKLIHSFIHEYNIYYGRHNQLCKNAR